MVHLSASVHIKYMDISLAMMKYCEDMTYFRDLSKETVRRHRSIIRQLITSQSLTTLDQTTSRNVRSFFFKGRTEAGWSPGTFRTYLATVKSFFNWCVRHELLKKNPAQDIERPKVSKKIPPKLTKQEAERILEVAYNYPYPRGQSFYAARNHAILSMFLHAGLRRQELLSLHIADANVEQLTVHVRNGKGGKERFIPMTYALAETLSRYLKLRRKHGKTCPELFTPLYKNTGLNPASLVDVLRTISDASGIPFRPHKLRHTFATLMLEGGCDIFTLSQLMGHSSIQTTTIYLAARTRHTRSQIRKHPLG